MTDKGTLVFLGGDRRSSVAAEKMKENGYRVTMLHEGGEECLREILTAEAVILPTPCTVDGRTVYGGRGSEPVAFRDFVRGVAGKTVIGGKVPDAWRREMENAGARVVDLTASETLACANALPSAEGALAIALQTSETTLYGARAVIVGYGRIAKRLLPMLLALGVDVTVVARSEAARASAKAAGGKAIDFDVWRGVLGEADFVVNTVPATVMDVGAIAALKQTAFIIDLASAPGGVDRGAAEAAGIRVIWALGLPGKVAPVSAGGYLANALSAILAEGEGNR